MRAREEVPLQPTYELLERTPGVVDCGGTKVRGNVVNIEADPDHVQLGMKVRLTTFAVGTDSAGTEAVGFGFEPIEGDR